MPPLPSWMPKPTLARKVFLALAALLMALLVVFVGLSRLGLQRTLGDYVAEIELSRMDWLATRLEQAYGASGGWQFLEQDSHAWTRLQMPGELLARGGPNRTPPTQRGNGLPDSGGPPPGAPGDHGPHPGGAPGLGDARQAQLDLLPDRFAPPPPPDAPNDPRARADSVYERMALLDPLARKHLAGKPISIESASKRPLLHAGTLIGYLAIAPLPSTQTDAGRAFIAQQSTFVVVSGLVGLALAILISWQLTTRWLSPIGALIDGAKRVAQGQLDTQVAVRGQDELATLTHTFNTMARELADTQAQRQRWLADVAHELRTPLAAMRAEIEAVQDGVRTFTPPTAERVRRQVVRLGQLVDDLRLSMNDSTAPVSDLRAGARPLDLLLEAATLMCSRFQQAGLALDLEHAGHLAQKFPVTMLADASRLHQVFVNLLENTLQYTQRGGRLAIEAAVHDTPAQRQLVITLDDSAPAPSPQDLPRLFERLYRGESSRDRKLGGSGLGLAICKAIVEAHGGAIAASLSPLGGLRMVLRLPLVGANDTPGSAA